MRLGELESSSTWPGATPERARRAMVEAPLAEGEVLDGKYRVERVLGAGGMGVVVAATHIRLAQRVAIKFLLPHAVEDEHTVARFAREARALARLDSEHIARVIDVGELATGVPYMVLEHLVGNTLADLLHTRGALPVDQAVAYVLEACEAMAEAHAAGIVHRDLKPENLFLAVRPDGTQIIKVIDFGISKMTESLELGPRSSTLTGAASIVGSPLYMSPEQLCAARDADPRSDIWSLGVTLFELLTTQGPFAWRSVPELCAAVLKEPARPLRELLPEAPEALEAVLLRCFEKEPSKRPADMTALADELAPFGLSEERISMSRSSRLRRAVVTIPTPEPDITPLQVADPEWTVRPSETLQLSGMTTGAEPETPSFWSMPRMAGLVFLAAMLVSLATVRGLRGRIHAPVAAAPAVSAAPFAPPPVTIEPEAPPPSLPLAPPTALPRSVGTAPPKTVPPRPRVPPTPRSSLQQSKIDSAFGHRK